MVGTGTATAGFPVTHGLVADVEGGSYFRQREAGFLAQSPAQARWRKCAAILRSFDQVIDCRHSPMMANRWLSGQGFRRRTMLRREFVRFGDGWLTVDNKYRSG